MMFNKRNQRKKSENLKESG